MIESRWRFQGWVQVVMAALAMVATLPGRTMGLGMITEPMLKDLKLDQLDFGTINSLATVVGALFCIPAGQLLDRFGSRWVLAAVLIGLGATILGMTGVSGLLPLLVLITLTRGLGQSALSVVSISMVGKWFDRRLALATAIYSVLLSLGFAGAFQGVGYLIRTQGWRVAWHYLGLALVVLAGLSWLLVRRAPAGPSNATATVDNPPTDGFTLREALRTPAFWLFGAGTSLFGLAYAGLSLFNEAVFKEHGFDTKTYHTLLAAAPLFGLVGQVVCGGLAQVWSYARVLCVALVVYGFGLLALTQVTTFPRLVTCAGLLGLAGGMITVIFFAIWAHVFGRRELGRIQGAVQMMTVFASAGGQVLFPFCFKYFGQSYNPAIYTLAAAVLVVAALAVLTPLPTRASITAPDESITEAAIV